MKINNKNNLKFVFSFLFFLFSLYCLLALGLSYDQVFHIENGERRLKYLFSLGLTEYYDILHLRYYPGLYDTISSLLSSAFPKNFYFEGYSLINFVFGIAGLIGLKKVIKFFFGFKVSIYFFLITLFSPIFFGHLFINPKDTIIATANFWIIYYLIRYLNTDSYQIRKNIAIKIGFFLGLGIGVRVLFLGTLIPIFCFFLYEYFFYKKITKKIDIIKFTSHFLIALLIAYILLIFCWPNTHSNIFLDPFNLFYESLLDKTQGVQVSYFFGNIYDTQNTPWHYLITNFLFKIPTYLLISFFLYLIYIKKIKHHFKLNNNFIYYSNICLSFLIIPIIISIILKLKIHDGVRYFFYLIPLVNIFPAIFFVFLFSNIKFFYSKLLTIFIAPLFLIFVYKFLIISPFHYSYLNFFNDLTFSKNLFENDYWGVSLKSLIKKFSHKINKQQFIRIASCGVNPINIKIYLKKYGIKNYNLVSLNENFDYAIMVNRAILEPLNNEKFNCFVKFQDKKTFVSVKKGSIELSKIIVN